MIVAWHLCNPIVIIDYIEGMGLFCIVMQVICLCMFDVPSTSFVLFCMSIMLKLVSMEPSHCAGIDSVRMTNRFKNLILKFLALRPLM